MSPGTGQVAHALLTRPPLSAGLLPRREVPRRPVRLACVKHAASVHPEPGSNSLIKCLILFRQRSAVFPFYCFRFILLNDLVKEFSRIVCVSLFSYQGFCRSTARLDYHIFPSLSTTILSFLNFLIVASQRQLRQNIISIGICQ